MCDEGFDAVDADGVEAVSEALTALSSDRAVMLVTHNPVLAAAVTASLRLQVDGGAIVSR